MGRCPVTVLKTRDGDIDITEPLIMGVLNVNPNSFSDAQSADSESQALARLADLIRDGADIVDVGGQSARTDESEIPESLEVDRITRIVERAVVDYPGVLISVDTYRPNVAREALKAGAHIINDVSGLRDPAIARLCVEYRAALVVMHTVALPKQRLQSRDLYVDVVAEVGDFLWSRLVIAEAEGLDRQWVILDPGPDFSKTPRQTLELLRGVDRYQAMGRPLLLALSRKDFLGALTGRMPKDRDAATHAAVGFFANRPGSIFRVHDVAGARDAMVTARALCGSVAVEADLLLSEDLRHERR